MILNGIVCDLEVIQNETREEARARLEKVFKKELTAKYLPEFNRPSLRIATTANPRFDKETGELIPDMQGLNLGSWMHHTRRGCYIARQTGDGNVEYTALRAGNEKDKEFVERVVVTSGLRGVRELDVDWKGIPNDAYGEPKATELSEKLAKND